MNDNVKPDEIEHVDSGAPEPATESNPNSRAARRRAQREASQANRTYSDHVVAAQTEAGRQLQLMNREQRRMMGVRARFESLN